MGLGVIGVQLDGGASLRVDVVEAVDGGEGVLALTRASEVVRGGD